MYRWAKERRKVAQEEKTKSGVARSYGEFDQALDSWISMVDDAAAITEGEKKAKKEEDDQRAVEVARVREAMRKTYSERRAEDSEVVEEGGQKRKSSDAKYCPAE